MVEPLLVLEPERQTTDPVLLNVLKKSKIDSRFVEFVQDYTTRENGGNPYSKKYYDRKSGKHFLVVSNLPMVKPDGTKIEVGFHYKDGRYYSKRNLFTALVDGTSVALVCLSDQPNGTLEGQQAKWNPQLFIGEGEVFPASDKAVLLPVDPLNSNYLENTLEWDYGVCKRRIRVVQGRFREWWIFNSNPGNKVTVKHNLTGDLKLHLGRLRGSDSLPVFCEVVDDKEIVYKTALEHAEYPIQIGASPETFYPDADPESTSVDGYAWKSNGIGSGVVWATLIAQAGDTAADDNADGIAMYYRSDEASGDWRYLLRCFFLFDTSALPDAAVIGETVLSLYGRDKTNTFAATNEEFAVYASAPTDNDAIVAGDYQNVSDTIFSGVHTYASWNTAGYNAFTFLQAGKDAISKTGVSKFCTRMLKDISGVAPTWEQAKIHLCHCWNAEQGAGYKPKLVVAYTGVAAPTVTTQAVTDKSGTTATGNGNITATGGENADKRGIVYSTSTHGDPGNTAPADSDYEGYEEEAGSFGTGAFTRSLIGLTSGQTYYVRAYAHNSVAYSYGGEVSFYIDTTGTVTTQAATNVSSKTATGNGNITATGGDNITKRGICYSASNAIPTVADPKVEEEGDFGTGAFTASLTGLTRNAKYYARAYVYKTAGYSYGSAVNFTTLKATTTLATAQTSTSRTPYIKMVFTSYDGNTTYDLSFDSGAYGKRVILIDHYEEPYNDYAIVVLRNHDLALSADMRGYWTEIGYGDVTGSGNEYELTPRLWVKHHQIVSAAGKLWMVLELEGAWAKMRETKLRIGNPPYYTATYSADTVLDIITTILAELDPAITPMVLTEDDGIIDTLTPVFELNTIQPFEDAGSSVYRLLKMTGSYLRHKHGLLAEIKYPQDTDSIDFTFYTTSQPSFREYTQRKNLVIPNHIYLFANAGTDNLWTDIITAEASNQDSIDAYGDVPDIALAPEIDNQSDANDRVAAILSRQAVEENAGSLVVKHDCRLELYDRISVADTRGL